MLRQLRLFLKRKDLESIEKNKALQCGEIKPGLYEIPSVNPQLGRISGKQHPRPGPVKIVWLRPRSSKRPEMAILVPLFEWVDSESQNEEINQNLQCLGTSLVVQWLRLRTPNAGGLGSIPGQGSRFRKPQLKSSHAPTKSKGSRFRKPQLKSSHAPTKSNKPNKKGIPQMQQLRPGTAQLKQKTYVLIDSRCTSTQARWRELSTTSSAARLLPQVHSTFKAECRDVSPTATPSPPATMGATWPTWGWKICRMDRKSLTAYPRSHHLSFFRLWQLTNSF